MGIPADAYDLFMSSGEFAYHLLREGGLAGTAQHCLLLSRGGDASPLEGTGLAAVTDADAAELVVIAGSEGDVRPLSDYEARLRPAARRHLPAVCLNPDRTMLTARGLAPGAGQIAELYEALGGTVTWVGKPHRPIYDHVLAALGDPPRARVVGLGDSVEHDIAGARAAGCAACLVRRGIIADASDAEDPRRMRPRPPRGPTPCWTHSRGTAAAPSDPPSRGCDCRRSVLRPHRPARRRRRGHDRRRAAPPRRDRMVPGLEQPGLEQPGLEQPGGALLWHRARDRGGDRRHAADRPAPARIGFRRLEGRPWLALPRAEVDRWIADPLRHSPPGGETGAALIARVRAFLGALGDGAHVVVSHGGPLKVIAALAAGREIDLWASPPGFGTVTEAIIVPPAPRPAG